MSVSIEQAVAKLHNYVLKADADLASRLSLLEQSSERQEKTVDHIRQSVDSLDSFVKNLIISLLVAILGLTGGLLVFTLQKTDTKSVVAKEHIDNKLW